MSGRYERVNAQDEEDAPSPIAVSRTHRLSQPNSPPPSFHSRASSVARRNRTVQDPTLADAFDADESDSDDEPDDRQRLVRQNTDPIQSSSSSAHRPAPYSAAGSASTPPPQPPPQQQPPSSAATSSNRIFGSGIQNEGVFSNLTAKPDRGATEKEEMPPTYEQAAADSAPPYWETTILAPGLGGIDDVYIDGMPVGSVFSFVWNGMISMSFQLVGFLLTYLLHSTHAAKNGSRAGLGITLIQYGFYMKGSSSGGGGSGAGGMGGDDGTGVGGDGYASPPDPNSHDFDPNTVASSGGGGGSGGLSDVASSEWVAYILMIVGWFILIRSVSDYLRARRHEQLVLQSPDRGLGVAIIAEGESSERVV
ncbi:hypothetical protein DHEL01_v200645 [Diaporthe helianthi]|uniref:Metal homeostatis protein bsd2 n=1 Tax=Diaporthe helianthi TaxID=158607 RepID=A0A2P5IEQ4_DIAHE|nr:hypothetical protein DHEL01_v200645 [Diaporthe helianthi]